MMVPFRTRACLFALAIVGVLAMNTDENEWNSAVEDNQVKAPDERATLRLNLQEARLEKDRAESVKNALMAALKCNPPDYSPTLMPKFREQCWSEALEEVNATDVEWAEQKYQAAKTAFDVAEMLLNRAQELFKNLADQKNPEVVALTAENKNENQKVVVKNLTDQNKVGGNKNEKVVVKNLTDQNTPEVVALKAEIKKLKNLMIDQKNQKNVESQKPAKTMGRRLLAVGRSSATTGDVIAPPAHARRLLGSGATRRRRRWAPLPAPTSAPTTGCLGSCFTVIDTTHSSQGDKGKYFNFNRPDSMTTNGDTVDVTQCRNGVSIWTGSIRYWTWEHSGTSPNGISSGDGTGHRNSGQADGQWQAGDVITTDISPLPAACRGSSNIALSLDSTPLDVWKNCGDHTLFSMQQSVDSWSYWYIKGMSGGTITEAQCLKFVSTAANGYNANPGCRDGGGGQSTSQPASDDFWSCTKPGVMHPHQASRNVVAFFLKRTVCIGTVCHTFKKSKCVKCESDIFDKTAYTSNTRVDYEHLRTQCGNPTECTGDDVWKFKKLAANW